MDTAPAPQPAAPEPALCAALEDILAGIKPGEVPQWIPLLPAGPRIQGRDGRRWTLGDAERVAQASRRHLPRLPLDWNHNTETRARSPRDGRAAGWIVALEVRGGAIWGQVEWTVDGAISVASREYRYVSPVFMHTPQGEVLHLTSAALTNAPNLKLKALNSGRGERMDAPDPPQQPAPAGAAPAAAAGQAAPPPGDAAPAATPPQDAAPPADAAQAASDRPGRGGFGECVRSTPEKQPPAAPLWRAGGKRPFGSGRSGGRPPGKGWVWGMGRKAPPGKQPPAAPKRPLRGLGQRPINVFLRRMHNGDFF